MNRLAGVLFTLALAAGCSGQPPVPEDHYYYLMRPATVESPAPLSDGVVFVESFIADGVHRERALTYMDGPATELKQYHYHHWVDSPARLLRDHLIDFLRAGNSAALVTDAPTERVELAIYGKIRRFDIIAGRGTAQVAVALEFRVVKAGSDGPPFVRLYERRQEANDRTINGSVEALSAALTDMYSELVKDLHEAM